jgi:hypothetical protein
MREERVAYKTEEPGPEREDVITDKPTDTKPCPICGEPIKESAKKCIHCGEFIEVEKRTFLGWLIDWTGIKDKTLWDWMNLLIIPIFLTIGGFLLVDLQEQRQNALEANRINANILQSYLDDMTTLVLDKSTTITQTEVQSIIRARTLTVLSELDGKRNGTVIRFLQDLQEETELIDLIRLDLEGIDLGEADLSGAELSGANLDGADLSGAKLWKANLDGADLDGANLSGAKLWKADLSGAYLYDANLSGANLYEADLSGAYLFEADLSEANLFGADLSEANLFGADLWMAELEGAKYHKKTVWPIGFAPEKAGAELVAD